jgi:hypothetical protein
MKLTLVLVVAVAALGGALLATVLGDDGATDGDQARGVAQTQTAPGEPEPASQAEQSSQAEETPNRDRSSRQRSDSRYVDPDDRPIGRRQLGRVRDAAVRAANGGTVTDIDRSDDLGVAFEVELVRNGREVDVRLDRKLAPVATDYDD